MTNWIDDGHTVRVMLEHNCLVHRPVCPFDGADFTGIAWSDLPECRKPYGDDGTPLPLDLVRVGPCRVIEDAKEFGADEFFDHDGEMELVSPAPIEYRLEPPEMYVYARPKPRAEERAPQVVHVVRLEGPTSEVFVGPCVGRQAEAWIQENHTPAWTMVQIAPLERPALRAADRDGFVHAPDSDERLRAAVAENLSGSRPDTGDDGT
jgi:hypothetical protein